MVSSDLITRVKISVCIPFSKAICAVDPFIAEVITYGSGYICGIYDTIWTRIPCVASVV